MIKVKNLTKFYGPNVAIDDVSFTAETGKITGFLGPNGAGKSTTMKIMTGFLSPDKGSVLFDKKSINLNFKKLAKDIGYLPESNPLYKTLRVDEFLTFSAKLLGVSETKNIKKVVKVCGIKKVLTKEINELSKGFRQRVGLAKALIADPKYLILDEPTEGLDPNQKEEILDLIKDIASEKTILFSSHVLSEVTEVADNVIIINNGKIVAQGDRKDLVKEHFKNAIVLVKTDAPKSKFTKQVEKMKSVSSVKSISRGRPKYREYEITCNEPEETSLAVFQLVSKNKWNLVELQTKSQGIEDLFKELTK